ncbi:MAG: hypothetical protein ACKPKO_39695, partial [Candidatus Fonsibacter sp.]
MITGMPNGYTWSGILNAFIWLGLQCTFCARFVAMARKWNLEVARRSYMTRMRDAGIRTAIQYVGWLRDAACDIACKKGKDISEVRGHLQALECYGYVKDYLQEYTMEFVNIGQRIQQGVYEAIRI